MRFSLRTLLLLFALVALSYAMAYLFARSEVLGKIAVNCTEFEAFQQNCDLAQRMFGRGLAKTDLSQLNAAMQGAKTTDAFNNFLLDHHFIHRTDAWGNPFHWIALDDNNQPLPGVQFADKFGFYSTGPDGVSQTAGNDPDDYNSWNTTPEAYQALMDRGHTHRIRMRTLQVLPAFFGLFCLGILIYQNRHKFGRQRVPIFTRDERPWAER